MLYERIVSREPVEKGWSGEKKYMAVTDDGERFLLRISSLERNERVERCFLNMKKVGVMSVSMCQALEWGICEEGVYFLQSWIEGQDAEEIIPSLSPEAQYSYGLSAGRDLRKLHSVPAPSDVEPWKLRFGNKIDRKLRMYEDSPLKYDNDRCILDYIAKNRELIASRPQTYQHGDHHIGNMMISRTGELFLVDFEKEDYGDPWEEFNRIVWSAQAAPYFASGIVDGYFEGDVPELFWRILALYICVNTVGSLPWAIPFGEREIRVMREQQKEILRWYDNMECTVPKWYHHSGLQNTTLREVLSQDKKAVISLLLNDKVAETYMIPENIDISLAERYYSRFLEISGMENRYFRIICADEEPVGVIHDVGIKENCIELGWAILPQYHGRGHGTEALRLAMNELSLRGFTDVVAGAFSENIPSIRIMEKNGMLRSCKEETICYRGKDRLCVYYEIKL